MIGEENQSIAERAKRVYEQQLRDKLEADAMHKFVAIDPESGDYSLGDTLGEASQALRTKRPGVRAYLMRVGHDVTIEFGGVRIERSR